ncbi:LuxR family transcriptional regulator [Streptomyces sp. XD-27]|uniref:LuxR family transcriptional regulator n=1 Tax=Streptomyces sp. XD-27 TaxID=3062779 RepID=UPI0026F47BE3|nr:LuxR family transcriptional regulator [Streptomyces sp. XD-27]WKX70491.1 LuxR C-terminal-related transcriptional regulator [Streptomyces sp. XD-27]
MLREAARQALADDRMEFAVSCLQLAERASTDERERLALRAALAQAMWRVKPLAQARQLQSLAKPARDGLLPPLQALGVALGLMWTGRMEDAAAAIEQVSRAAAEDPGSEVDDELRVIGLTLASTYPGAPELKRFQERWFPHDARRQLADPAADSPRLTAMRALHTVLTMGADEHAVRAAERVLEHTRLGNTTVFTLRAALLTLIYADRLTTATIWCDRILTESARRGTPAWLACFYAVRAGISLRVGRLTEAVGYAEQALEELPARGWGLGIGVPLSVLVSAHTAMGRHDEAAELLSRPVPEQLFQTRYGLHYLHARGRHQLATGRHHAALTDFRACGDQMPLWGLDSPAVVPWRLGAAEAWLALGDQEQAARLADSQLELLSPSQTRARGAALRLVAATRPLAERPALLQEAVRLLQDSGSWYGMARALADLGEVHKEMGDLPKSRLMTRWAWRMADGCGAQELARRLRPTPGRTAPSESASAAGGGADTAAFATLTDAERRVASLAAAGHTNREIAAKLYITVSTVEQHLTRVYRKINISQRQDLPASLDRYVAHTA